MFNFRFLWPTTMFGGAAASLGALIHSVLADGAASLTQFGVGSGLAATVIAVVVRMHANWRAAGGKFDGKITDAEARAILGATAAELKLPARVRSTAEQLAPQAARLGNQLIAGVEDTVPGATELIGSISQYLNDPAEDADHTALLWKFIDVLSKEIAGNAAGEDLIAKFRDQVDLKLFPGTPVSTPAAS